ncbi:hypothetical protein N325_09376, partial [Colius striatus]
AAIDFLLLAHSHGCQDFEGMCCFNLSDHSESIHKALPYLKVHAKNVTVGYNLFDDWFQS